MPASGSPSCLRRPSRWPPRTLPPPRSGSPTLARRPVLALLHSSAWFSLELRARPRPTSREWSTNRIHRRNGMRALILIAIAMCTALTPRRGGSAGRGGAAATARAAPEAARLGHGAAQAPGGPTAAAGSDYSCGCSGLPPESPRRRHPRLRRPPMDLARPRQPFGLYPAARLGSAPVRHGRRRRLRRQHQRSAMSREAGGGTFAGQENRFYPREVELSLFGQIDPYASAVVRFESGRRNARPGDCRHLGGSLPHTPHAPVRHPGETRPDAQSPMAGRTRSTSTICRGSTAPTSCATSSAPKACRKRASK